ncbi:MAG: gliding motility-associated C-terminal domain-containing protein [Saprospiraceae bacterium]|nr:gliding motility-associated C-terminal domain-containing protein [Saprospiraceae bacterium]
MKPAKYFLMTAGLFWMVQHMALGQCPTLGTTVVVSNTSSNPLTPNSFAWAINCINNTTPLTTITFNIPPAGINTIFLTSGLPVVTKPNAIIDGTITESVIVDGTSAAGAAPINGLVLSGSGITVRGIQIRNFTNGSTGGHAIRLVGSLGYNIEDNILYGNRIGIGTTVTNLDLNITGNTIGLNAAGVPNGNTAGGIVLPAVVAASNISDNTIAHNGGGIAITSGSTVRISENSMYCNTGSGIDRTDGPAVPIITNASTLAISGTATAGQLVEVFEYDPSGCPSTAACQGRTFLGAVTALATGTWTLNLTAANPVNPANSVTATATQSGSNTSRFATCRSIVNCNTFTVSITVNPIDCNGDSNGSLTAVPSGTPGPYFYSWNTGGTTPTISGLGPGTYTVVVTDAAGCTFTAAATLSDPPLLTLDFSTTNVSCAGAENGSATAIPGGGVPGYGYLWSNSATTPTINNLAHGTYSVTVVDNSPCRILGSVTITEPAALTLNVTSTGETMFGTDDGTATATVAGGTGPYEYLWSNGGITSTISNLPPGAYSVTVTDANDCTIEGSGTVAPFDCGAFSVTIDANDPLCNGESTGSATAIPVGGVAPHDYLWNTSAITPTISGLPGGIFSVIVTDANNCPAEQSVILTSPPPLMLSLSTTDQTMFAVNDGTATATASGGTGILLYDWSNGGTTASITNLPPGTYTVTVTDANGCTIEDSGSVAPFDCSTFSVVIDGSDPLCNGESTGTAMAIPIGGTGPYDYLWNSGAITPTINGLAAGAYAVTVTDANNCSFTQNIVLFSPTALFLDLTSTGETMIDVNDGTATANVSGGTGSYEYLWSNGGDTETITGLPPGIYSVTVTDENDCTRTGSVLVDEITCAGFTLTVNVVNVSCNGEADGSATAIPVGMGGSFTYVWNTGAITPSISNLAPGTYTVTVSDAAGCQEVSSGVISQPNPLTLQVTATDETALGANNGTATATASGGTGPITYLWSNTGVTPTIANLAPGTYSVTVMDGNGCTRTGSVVVASFSCAGFSVSITNVVNVACNGETTGAATTNVSGGGTPFVYNWSNGTTDATLTNVGAGTYSVTVENLTGCTDIASVTINEPAALLLDCSQDMPVSQPGGSDGQGRIGISGGTANYTINYTGPSNGQLNNVLPGFTLIPGLPAGAYAVTVTDDNGCTQTCGFTINAANCNLRIDSITVNQVSCFGGSDGALTVNLSNGAGNLMFTWSNPALNGQQNPSGLLAGSYSVTIVDMPGCTANATAVINQPAALVVQVSATNETTIGANDGTATANVSGGTMPYNYVWSNGATTPGISNLAPGVYTVTVTATVAGVSVCPVTGSGTVVAGGTGGGDCRALPAYALSVPDEVCQGEVFTLNADDLFPSPAVNYVWLLPNGDSVITTQLFVNLVASSTAFSGEYFVLRDSLGCRSIPLGAAPMTVLGLPDGAVFAGVDTVICASSTATLSALPLVIGTGVWRSLGAAKLENPTQLVAIASNLQVGANRFVWEVSIEGCPKVAADTVTLFSERAPILGDDNYRLQFANQILVMEVLLNDNLAGLTDTIMYLLNEPEEGVLVFLEATNRFRYIVDESFRGVVTFQYVVCPPESNCQLPCDTATVRIEVFNQPSVSEGLIINDSGRNGFMEIKGIGGFSKVEILVVNRWGDLVYKSEDYAGEAPWNGTMQGSGKPLPQGAYYYQLRAFEGEEQVGDTQTGVIHLFEQKF